MPITRTNARTLLAVLVRVAALVMLASLVANTMVTWLTWTPQTPGQPQPVDGVLGGLLAASLLVVVLIWHFADFIAKCAVGRREDPVFDSGIDVAGWQAVAFAAVGAYFVVVHGVGLARSAMLRLLDTPPWVVLADESRRAIVVDIVADVLGLALGVGLVLGARGLAGVVHRLRHGRRSPD